MTAAMNRDEDYSVWVRSKNRGKKTKLHLDPECSRIKGDMTEKMRSMYPDDTEICKYCRDDVDRSDTAGQDNKDTRRKLLSMAPEDLGLSPAGGST